MRVLIADKLAPFVAGRLQDLGARVDLDRGEGPQREAQDLRVDVDDRGGRVRCQTHASVTAEVRALASAAAAVVRDGR